MRSCLRARNPLYVSACNGDVNFQRASKNPSANQTMATTADQKKKHLLLQCICCSCWRIKTKIIFICCLFVAVALFDCPAKCGPIFHLANQNKIYSISRQFCRFCFLFQQNEKVELDLQPRWTILIRCNSHSVHLIRHSPRWFWWICRTLFHLFSAPIEFFCSFRWAKNWQLHDFYRHFQPK